MTTQPIHIIKSPDILFRMMEDGGMIVDLRTLSCYELNDVSTRMWQLLDHHGDLETVVAQLRREYDVENATLYQDLTYLLAELNEANLVVIEPLGALTQFGIKQKFPKNPKKQACTKDTERCEFWTWEEEYLRPECCTRYLKELLFFTEDLLTRHGIFHWLDFGSLLGAVRHQALISWDTDIDFGVLKVDLEQILALEAEINQSGYYLNRDDPQVLRIQYSQMNTQHVDIFPWWEEHGILKLTWSWEPSKEWYFPSRYVERLKPVDLYGKAFPAPAPIHDFLVNYRYGPDYMTPRRVEACKTDTFVREFRLKKKFEENLALLNKVLAKTTLADRYWIWGGVLLGWAREGRILPHDYLDADLAYFREDRNKFLGAIDALIEAGFQPHCQWVNDNGCVTEHVFIKDGASFDFFELYKEGDHATYWLYAPLEIKNAWIELIGVVPVHEFSHMQFLKRTWRKPADHETFLTAVYGDWRTPNPYFNFVRDEKSIIQRTLRVGTNLPRINFHK